MSSDRALAGKSALITGGARRIGRAIALALAKAGADVTITYLASEREARQTVRDLEEAGQRAQALECDVRSEDSVRAAVAAAAAYHARLDVLVNNAAVFETARLESLTLDQWDTMFET